MPISSALSKGKVYWITGLSGSGKSTLAQLLHEYLLSLGQSVVLLDGDKLREIFNFDLGHDLKDRHTSAFRNVRLCHFLSESGIDVICPTISMFEDCRQWGRKNIAHFYEIYLQVPLEVLKQRDPKHIYRNGQQVVGLDLPWEPPLSPHLLIENHGDIGPREALEKVRQGLCL